MREARALELLADISADGLVLPEDHAAQQRCLGRRQPGAEPAHRPFARLVQPPEQAAARAAGRLPRDHVDRGARAAPPLVRVEVAERRDGAAKVQLAADADIRPRPPVGRVRDGHFAGEVVRAERLPAHVDLGATREADARHRAAVGAQAHRLEQDRAHVDPPPGQRRQRAGRDRLDARLRERRARESGHGGDHAQRHATGQPRRRAGHHQHPGGRDRPEQEPGGDCEQHEVARMAADLLDRSHSVNSSRSDASRLSPMPGISPSSSIEPNPPTSSR